MTPTNRDKLARRVHAAAEAALAAKGFVSCIDVLIGMDWTTQEKVARWRKGQVDCLERVVLASLKRISTAMWMFRSWAAKRKLLPRETAYGRQRHPLRFSRSGDATIERLYRTHWVSPRLVEETRKRAAERASRPPAEAQLVAEAALLEESGSREDDEVLLEIDSVRRGDWTFPDDEIPF